MSVRAITLVAALVSSLGGTLSIAPAQAQAEGVVRTVDGRELRGALTVAEGSAVTVTGEAGTTSLDVAELLSFERDGAERRNVETEDRVWLRSGLELPAKKLTGRLAQDGRPAVLIARLPCGADVELPLSTVRAVRHGGLLRPRPNLFPADLESPPANDDLIYVYKDGQAQRSAVTITGFTPKSVEFLLRGDAYEFELDGLAAAVFGTNTGFAPDRQPRPRVTVSLTTGERIEGKLLSLGETVRWRLDEGCVLEVPVARLFRLDVASDRLVWLSELEPKVEQTAAFDRVWPVRVGRSEAGPGFELGGRRFERGIGLVPHARLTYTIDGRFDVFEATIGIDDRGGPEAHAVFRVYVAGKLAFESQPMTRGMQPQAVRVALEGAETFAIEVDFGKNYDLGDFCAFADARVVQQ